MRFVLSFSALALALCSFGCSETDQRRMQADWDRMWGNTNTSDVANLCTHPNCTMACCRKDDKNRMVCSTGACVATNRR